MSVVVFCGPTLTHAEVHERIDAICLPPARHGDILRAMNIVPRPHVIAIIDGLFRTVPAVRHKEILWALSQGIHVFGAASMGALRAAELCDFGMIGVGSIFSDYGSGRIEDDDEVAVEHGPVETGFMPISEAMVDVRATLAAARKKGVIGEEAAEWITARAKELFYARRNWSDLIEDARRSGCDRSEIEALDAWLPSGRVNQKRLDALELLDRLRDFVATNPPPFRPEFTFERTEVWDLDVEAAQGLPSIGGETDTLLLGDILDELRLSPDDFADARREALTRMLLIREARRSRGDAEPEEKEAVLKNWLRNQGGGLQNTLECNQMSEADLAAFLNEEVLVRWAADSLDAAGRSRILDALRSQGKLAQLVERVQAKRHALRMMGKEEETTQTGNIVPAALVGWFWRRTFPNEMQLISTDALAVQLGFADVSDMTRALLREYLFSEYCRENDLPIRVSRLT